MEETKYIYELPTNTVQGDTDKGIVKRMLETIEYGKRINDDRKEELQEIQNAYENAFAVEEQEGSRFMYSTLLMTMCKKVYERLDLLNWDINFYAKDPIDEDEIRKKVISGLKRRGLNDEEAERQYLLDLETRLEREDEEGKIMPAIAKAAIQEVMQKGGFSSVIKESKDSAYSRSVSIGDSFIQINPQEGDYPIEYEIVSQENVLIDPQAIQIRGAASGRNLERVALIYNYTYDNYVDKVVNKLEGKAKQRALNVQWGELPITVDKDEKFNERDNEIEDDRIGQVCMYVDIPAREVVWAAGSAATIIKREKGDDFPFIKDKKPYIPLAHFMAMPSTKGFHNKGVGHYMYQKNYIDELVKNKTISSVLKRIDPYWIIDTTPENSSNLISQFYAADEAASKGEPAIIINEVRPGQQGIGNVQSLSGEAPSDIGAVVENILTKDIVEFGISPSETQTQSTKTATAILSEQENANTLVREIAKRIAPEYRFLIEITIEYMKKLISTRSKVRFDTSNIEPANLAQRLLLRSVTLGRVVEFLKKHNYRIKMDSLSGIIPTNAVEAARLMEAYQLAAATPAGARILQKMLALRNINYDVSDLTIQQQEPEQPGMPGEGQELIQQENQFV